MASIGPETIAFIQLKLTCNQIMEGTSQESIDRLTKLIQSSPKSSIKNMQSHVLFVLMQVIQQKELRSKLKIAAIECMELVLCSAELSKNDPIFDSLILCLMSLMYNPESDNLVADLPEELHLGCIKCVSLLLQRMKLKDRIQLYSAKQAPMLGVLVCICLKQASVQQLRPLRIAAIECLMNCAQVLEQPCVPDPELRHKTADIFMNFLPGIAAGLQQVISGDEKQGHALFVVAVRAWGRLLAQVLDEEGLPAEESILPNLTSDTQNSEQGGNTLSSAQTSSDIEQLMSKNKRTPTWLSYADAKLMGNVRSVCLVHRHSHPKVRRELALTAELLISKCSRSLPKCVPHLLEVLLILSEDDVEEVSAVAKDALQLLTNKCSEEHGRSLVEHLEESLFTLISSIPTNFIHSEFKQQKSQLNLLLGHLKLLEHQLPDALLLASHWDALLQGLLQIATLDCGTVITLAECPNKALYLTEIGISRQWCQFRYFSDAAIVKQLSLVCQILGEKADLALLVSQLLGVFTDRPAQRAEAALLLNFILGTSFPDKASVHLKSVQSVLKIYLDPEIWKVPLSLEESIEPLTLASMRRNIVQTCIVTEGIALLTAATGAQAKTFLADVLYPILERTGSPLELVAQAGLLGLNILASVLGHDSPTQLIRKEADYFTKAISVGLQHPNDNPAALLVLSAVLTHSNCDILPCLKNIILDALTKSCDTYHEQNLTAYLQIFYTFVWNVQRWIAEDQQKNISETCEVNEAKANMKEVSLLVQELLIHHKWKLEAGEEELEDEITEDFSQMYSKPTEEEPLNDMDQLNQMENETDDAEEEPDKDVKVVPNYVSMTEAVMQRCTHALPSPNKERQLLAISTLTIGIKVLACHEDQLLPMVHRIWSPLLQRFSPTQDIVVLRHSFELLCTMAQAAKGFLKKRTLDKVLPSLSNFLKKQVEISRKQRVEVYSQSYKLQKAILECLGQLGIDLELQEEDLEILMTAASPYLSSEQPLPLQESCLKLFSDFKKINSEAVWLHLRMLWNSEPELHSPHSSCQLIRFPKSSLDGQQFKKNIELLESTF